MSSTFPTTTALPGVRKTKRMREIEAAHDYTDLREVILSKLLAYPSNKEAAATIGISESLLSHWIAKLGIDSQARAARHARFH